MNSETTVVNIKHDNYDTYIGLGTRWGNRFVKRNMTNKERSEVCDKYKQWFWDNNLVYHIHELEGKVLGCHCKPKQCHGDFLARVANSRVPIKFN